MSIRLFVGHCDLTDEATALEWSTVDNGGFELASFDVANDQTCPTPGSQVVIRAGLDRVFMGRVEEPGDNFDEHRAPGQVAAVGAGAAAKDNQASMVFMDRAAGRWQGPAHARQTALVTAGYSAQAPAVRPDVTNGAPSLETMFQGASTTNGKCIAEAWYDAGAGNLIGRVRATWTRGANVNNADTNYQWLVQICAGDDQSGPAGNTGDQRAAGPGTIDLAATGSARFALIQFLYGAAGLTDAVAYDLQWTNPRVVGNHGLTIRGATAAEEGFYPSDIAGWAMDQVTGVARGFVIDSTDLILPHSAYYTPADHERFALDMAALMGWHYGVWEPADFASDTPRWDFRSRPTDATVVVDRSDCRNLRLAQRLSDLHDRATITYQDPAGTTGVVTVTRANPRLPASLARTLPLDAGRSSAAVAQQIAEDTLELEEQQTRAAGSVQLPPYVRTTTGVKPSYLLKAGLDRLKITGLPNAGAWSETDSRRFDTFRIRRLTHKVQPGGAIVTTAELDSGANLIETLQARLAVAAALAG